MKYRRVLLKLSGEALMGSKQFGIDNQQLALYAHEVEALVKAGVEVAVVIGGGNIFRGVQAAEGGMERTQGDYMGMLATMINAMALQSALEHIGLDTRLQSAIEMKAIAEPVIRRRPCATSKRAAWSFSARAPGIRSSRPTVPSLRAIEIEADVILKGTRVDGIYSADPEKDPDATRYSSLFEEVFQRA